MGRHRSSLRDLGWGVSNSPNPWKQGSAKRVVRALDMSNVHDVAEPAPEPATVPAAAGSVRAEASENEAPGARRPTLTARSNRPACSTARVLSAARPLRSPAAFGEDRGAAHGRGQ